MGTKLHVGSSAATVAEDDLKATFGQFGVVESVEIARDRATGRGRGFAIVSMTHDDEVSQAIGRLDFSQYAGRTIGVSRSQSQQRSRRLDQ